MAIDKRNPIDTKEFTEMATKVGLKAFTPAAAQADSTSVDVEGIVSDFNDLLAKLRTAGIMST